MSSIASSGSSSPFGRIQPEFERSTVVAAASSALSPTSAPNPKGLRNRTITLEAIPHDDDPLCFPKEPKDSIDRSLPPVPFPQRPASSVEEVVLSNFMYQLRKLNKERKFDELTTLLEGALPKKLHGDEFTIELASFLLEGDRVASSFTAALLNLLPDSARQSAFLGACRLKHLNTMKTIQSLHPIGFSDHPNFLLACFIGVIDINFEKGLTYLLKVVKEIPEYEHRKIEQMLRGTAYEEKLRAVEVKRCPYHR